MNNPHRKFYFSAVLSAVLLLNAGCGSAQTNVEKIENRGADSAASSRKTIRRDKSAAKTIAPASVAGKYERDTHRNGEGFDNEMEITDAGGGKLNVYISGSYIYRVGETQTFKEAEGKGNAILNGSVAKATLVDEAGTKPCLATITFTADAADVKIPDTCRFNIRLGGIYRKVDSESANTEQRQNAPDENAKLPEITFDELMSYANESSAEQVGEEFIIKNVPAAKLDKKVFAADFSADDRKLYFLEEADDDGYIGNALLVSQEMVNSLNVNAKGKPAKLRLTARLVESNDEINIIRIAFVTKIEGLDKTGKVLWTATSAKPEKLHFTH